MASTSRRSRSAWFHSFAGAPIEFGPYAQNWTIRDGRIAAMRVYTEIDEGLRAAGLDPAAVDE